MQLGDLYLNHAETDLFSEEGQPALLLHWHGNRPAAPMILQMFLSTWWMSGQDERKWDTHISPSCLQNLQALVQSQSSALTLALPKTLGWIYTALTPFTAFKAFIMATGQQPRWSYKSSCLLGDRVDRMRRNGTHASHQVASKIFKH